jgi:hypothetical protein
MPKRECDSSSGIGTRQQFGRYQTKCSQLASYQPPLRITTEMLMPGTCLSRFQVSHLRLPGAHNMRWGGILEYARLSELHQLNPTRSISNGRLTPPDRRLFQSSEYLTPMLCRNLRSSAVSSVGLGLGRFADAEGKHARQQSERGFTLQTFLRHRGHRRDCF